jgi:hypothetical protein
LRQTESVLNVMIENDLDGEVEVHAVDAQTARLVQRLVDRTIGPQTSTDGRIRNLTIAYTDSSGLALDGVLRYPTRLAVDGTLALVMPAISADTLRLTISTPDPLRPDLLCGVARYRSGELRADADFLAQPVSLRFAC